jgi:plastocyanin
MRVLLAMTGATFLLLVGFIVAPAVVAGDPCYHGFDIPPRSEGAETQIKVAPCAFGPTVSHVATGSTVTFFNGPDFTHLITGANAEWGSRDVELRPSQKVSYTFANAGIYPYACALHRGMSGTIVVGDVSAPATAPAIATTSSHASASGPGPGQIVAAGVVGILLGAVGAFGVMRVRTRRDHGITEITPESMA